MKYGFTSCNYDHLDIYECLSFAKQNGFDFLEGYWEHMLNEIRNDGLKIANAVKESGMNLTIHHGLPNPDAPEKIESFRKSIKDIFDWSEKYGVLNILSFDTWVDREKSFYLLLEVLEMFKNSNVKILTEDCPVNDTQFDMWYEATKYKNYGLLLDLGHMNVRLSDKGDQKIWCLVHEGDSYPSEKGDNSPEAFKNALTNKRLPVYEFHIHNNDGTKDNHCPIHQGTANFKEIAKVIVDMGFDVYADFEVGPNIHEAFGKDAEAMLLNDFKTFKAYIEEAKR